MCVCAYLMFTFFLNSSFVLTFTDRFSGADSGICSSLTATPLSSLPPFQAKHILFVFPYILLYIASFSWFSQTRASLYTNWDTNAQVMPICLPACLHCMSARLSADLPTAHSLSLFPTFSHSEIKEPKGARLLR